MSVPKPCFHLARVYADGTQDAPEIVPLAQLPGDVRTGRRGFLRTGVSAAALLGAVAAAGCAPREEAAPVVDTSPAPMLETKSTAEPSVAMETSNESGLVAHNGPVIALAFGPGGLLVSAGEDKAIKVWQLPEGARLRTLPAHAEGVVDLAVTPDGRDLISADADGRLRFWELPDGRRPRVLLAHSGGVRGLALDGSGLRLISCGQDGYARARRLPGGERFAAWPVPSAGQPGALALTRDGQFAASEAEGYQVALRRLPDGPSTLLAGHTAPLHDLAFASDGGCLITASQDGTVRAWSVPQGTPQGSATGATAVQSVAVSLEGWVAWGNGDGQLALGRLPSIAQVRSWPAHSGIVRALAVSPDARLLASGGEDGRIRVWTLPAGAAHADLIDLKACPPTVRAAKYETVTQDGRVLHFTRPAGTISPGAKCTCNTVSGVYGQPSLPTPEPIPEASSPSYGGSTPSYGGSGGYGGEICTCNQVCICMAV